MKNPQEIAIARLKFFHVMCDEYNKNGLTEFSPVLLKVFHESIQDVFPMFKFVHSKQPCEATQAYLVFCGKLLLRFSYLREYGRKETSAETADYFRHFVSRNGHRLYNTH